MTYTVACKSGPASDGTLNHFHPVENQRIHHTSKVSQYWLRQTTWLGQYCHAACHAASHAARMRGCLRKHPRQLQTTTKVEAPASHY